MNPALDDGSDFAIAVALLDDSGSGWCNLGDWQSATEYAAACAALARAVGHAAGLHAQDRVLELACGKGAGMTLWRSEFSVQECVGIDRQPPDLPHCLHARFDVLPLPAALQPHSFTAVVCVDAAYHADSLEAFVRVAGDALAADGRLAFSTLLQGSGWDESRAAVRMLRRLLAAARIPAASVPDENAVRAALQQQGYTDIVIRHRDAAVLAGFADYVQRRGRALPWLARCRAGWWKIRATAALCRYVYGRQLLHYSLVSARRDIRNPAAC